MNYLVVYPNYDRQTEEKELFADTDTAADYIEGILRAGTVKDDQVSVYEIKPIDYQIERVPVVKIGGDITQPVTDAMTIAPEITTAEDIAANDSYGHEDSEAKVEVFTFET